MAAAKTSSKSIFYLHVSVKYLRKLEYYSWVNKISFRKESRVIEIIICHTCAVLVYLVRLCGLDQNDMDRFKCGNFF